MGRITMHIAVDNQSDATLVFVRDEIEVGSYTPDLSPPPSIGPHQTLGFKAEGALVVVPTTGTQGSVWYQIMTADGNAGELAIHWNSPLVESQFGNTFHIFAPPNWELAHSGGQGHNAELRVRVRRTARRSVPRFRVPGRSFKFTNSWSPDLPVISVGFLWNKLFESAPGPLGELGIEKVIDENFLPLTHANAGLCGGMVYAVMDYYSARLFPPLQKTPPNSQNDALFQFIRDRLWDSFDVGGGGHRFLGYSSPHYPNGDEGAIQAVGLARGRSWVTYREAWPLVQQDIDEGRLSPLGLIQTDDLKIGDNHQVLAYAYEMSGQDVRLYIYDPNEETEVVFAFNVTSTDGEVHIARSGGQPSSHRIFCFFRIDGYAPKQPPNGLRLNGVREAIEYVMPPPFSLRAAVQAVPSAHGSVKSWLQSV